MYLLHRLGRLTGLWTGLLLIVFSLLLLSLGWKAYRRVEAYTARQAQTTGRVVAVVAQQRPEATGALRTFYYPVVEFTTPAGEVIRFQDNTGVDRPSLLPPKGDRVKVLYDPDNPQVAMIASWSNLWLLPAVLLGVGSLFALLGLWLFVEGIFSLLGLSLLPLLLAWLWRNRQNR